MTACAFSLHKNTENYVIVDLVKFTVCQLFFCGTVLLCTSGLPGQRPVTPCVCGALRCSIHPLHCAPRAGHCCPTRAGPVPFLKIAPQSSARGRNWPVPKLYRRPAQASVRSPCHQCGGFVPFLNSILCRNRQFCTVFRIFTH